MAVVRAPRAPSLAVAVGLHAQEALRSMWSARRLWPAIALLFLLALITALLARYAPEDGLAATEFFGSFGVTAIALTGIGYGSSAVRGAVDRGALSLYLLRPRGTLAWPLGQWLATASSVAAIGGVSAGLVFVAAALASVTPESGLLLPMLLCGALAGLGWTSVAMFCASFSRRGATLAVVWYVVVDLQLSRFIDGLAWLTPGPALRALLALPPSHQLLVTDGWAAVGQLLLIGLAAGALCTWRISRDEPL